MKRVHGKNNHLLTQFRVFFQRIYAHLFGHLKADVYMHQASFQLFFIALLLTLKVNYVIQNF